MSSISGTRSNSSNPTETPRNPRDREVETLKQELRDINENHRAELTKLEDENKKRLDQVHTDANAKLNEKDIQHQKEIETIRAMYNKRSIET